MKTYEERVQADKVEGCTRSDAQAVVDAELKDYNSSTNQEIKVTIKHFNNENEKIKAKKYAKANGLKEFNSLALQFSMIPEGIYEIETEHIFNNQYNTKGKNGHNGYRIFEYCEKLSTQSVRPMNTGYYISKGIDKIREYQGHIKTCGYCGKQYYDTKKVFCNACLGSQYLEEKDYKLLFLRIFFYVDV